MLAVLAYL